MGQDTWNGKVMGSNAGLAEQAPVRHDPQAAESSQTCVLLVEDEALIAELIAEALEEHGFSVHAVSNATDALAHLSSGSRVDILFTDINLPGELDGTALAERLRGLVPDLPVIYASGRWSLLERLGSLPLSITLQKPYSAARACAAVDVLISQRGAMLQHQPAPQKVLTS